MHRTACKLQTLRLQTRLHQCKNKSGQRIVGLSEAAKMVGHCTSISDLPYTTVAYRGAQSMQVAFAMVMVNACHHLATGHPRLCCPE